MSRKTDSDELRSPRWSSRSPAPAPLQFAPRLHVDADGLRASDADDRSVFQRYVAETLSPTRSSNNGGCVSSSPTASTWSPRLAIRSPRAPASAETTRELLGSLDTARAMRAGAPRYQLAGEQSPTKLAKHRPVMRPHSPVGELPPESAVSLRGTPRRRAVLATSDVDKITVWLRSLERETKAFSSYFLYCEMLLRESRVLTQGKPSPNRLQTAVAFHCLCKATSVFARHEHLLVAICRDLAAAIFVAHEQLPIGSGEIEALECFSQQLTYYDNERQLQHQRDHLHEDMLEQRALFETRLEQERAQQGRVKELEQRYQVKSLDKISHRNTAQDELKDRLHAVLNHFQHMDDPGKQKVVLGVVDSLRAHVTADTLFRLTDHMSLYEKDKLLHQLFQDELAQMTDKIRAEVIASLSVQQNAILERSVSRITRFQALVSGLVRPKTGDAAAAHEPPDRQSALADFRRSSRAMLDDDDISDADRKVLEAVGDVVDELHSERQRAAELQLQLDDAEQQLTRLRWKHNALATDAQEAARKHALELEALQQELARLTVLERDDKAVQTDRRRRGGGSGFDDDDDGDGDDDDGAGGTGAAGLGGKSRASRRRLVGAATDDEDLILKNRRTNKLGVGIASLIEQAKIPSSKIRKILSKRKPLTLNELHAIIVGYYQAKMVQDAQDDAAGKLRSNLAQFIMEMYVLHYGLKDLAISQLVFLDASIRKHARESARVRTFGLLTGSLDPESHACSVQGVDFFLFVVVVLFNAGAYKKGRKHAVAIAQSLKSVFGDGIFMSPNAATIKSDLVCQAIDLVFSYTRTEPGGALERLKDELRRGAAASTLGQSGGLEIDLVLERLMNHWFAIYEQQIQDIHAMFALVDANGDGSLDFREFCEIVVVLEPDIDRRDALALYNRAAGDDHVIDKDEFVQVMLAHQRGVILKEFYGGDSSKKIVLGIQQRKQTFGVASPSAGVGTGRRGVEFQSLAGAMDALDREESYASLAAAMSSITGRAAATAEDELVDDDSDDADADADRLMKESVSFMTLSRLSLWASEAKGKLQNAKSSSLSAPGGPGGPGGLSASAGGGGTRRQLESGSLRPVLEGEGDFESDVDELLRQALSKVNIRVGDLFQ